MSPNGLIAMPIMPGGLKDCPHCLAARSQKFVRTDKHEKLGDVQVYACEKCGKEIEYLISLPPNVV